MSNLVLQNIAVYLELLYTYIAYSYTYWVHVDITIILFAVYSLQLSELGGQFPQQIRTFYWSFLFFTVQFVHFTTPCNISLYRV